VDVASFLGQHHPFNGLDADLLEAVAGSVLIEFFPGGTTILEQDGQPAAYLYVLRSGAVEILDQGSLVDLAGEGEIFGELSLISGATPSATVRAHEDTLCYLIDPKAAAEALASAPGLSTIGNSLRRLAARRDRREGQEAFGRVRVSSLIRRPAVSFPPNGTVGEAASRMAEDRISSLLIPWEGGWGILTDRDLRSRVLATGRTRETKVAEVMTVPARTIPSDSMAGEALLAMLDGGFHHLPVIDAQGALAGVVTDTDLMGLARQSPFALKSAIERSPSEDEAVAAARRLPEVPASWSRPASTRSTWGT
jgi:CBS domain-containing protein